MKTFIKFKPFLKEIGAMFFWGWLIFVLFYLYHGSNIFEQYKTFPKIFWDLNMSSPFILWTGIILAFFALVIAISPNKT